MARICVCSAGLAILAMPTLCRMLSVVSDNSPKIDAHGKFVIGSSQILQCTMTNAEVNVYGIFPLSWHRKSDPDAHVYAWKQASNAWSKKYQSFLRFYEVRKSMHREEYICTCRSGDNVTSAHFRVEVIQPPAPPTLAGPDIVVSGQANTWRCDVWGASHGAPDTVLVFGNGSRIRTGVTTLPASVYRDPDSGAYRTPDSALTLYDVSVSMTLTFSPSGLKSCLLVCSTIHQESGATKNAIVNVTILHPPLVRGDTNYKVKVGDRVTIQCLVSSESHVSSVTWCKDEAPVDIGGSWRFSGGSKDDPSLTIQDAVEADGGSYVCVVRNEHGNTTSAVRHLAVSASPGQVSVVSPPKQPEPPHVHSPGRSLATESPPMDAVILSFPDAASVEPHHGHSTRPSLAHAPDSTSPHSVASWSTGSPGDGATDADSTQEHEPGQETRPNDTLAASVRGNMSRPGVSGSVDTVCLGFTPADTGFCNVYPVILVLVVVIIVSCLCVYFVVRRSRQHPTFRRQFL